MNGSSGRSFLRPVPDIIDVDEVEMDTDAIATDDHDVTHSRSQSRSQTEEISTALSSSPSEDEVRDAESLKLVAQNWLNDSKGLKKAACWAFFQVQEGADSRSSNAVPVFCWICSEGNISRGKMVWKRDNGTKAMLSHVRTFHKVLLDSHEASLVKPVAKKRTTAGSIAELNKCWAEKGSKKYALDNKKQKDFEKNVGLLVGKGLVPMYIVEVLWFVRMILHCDSRLTLPSRKKVTKAILPNLAKSALDIVTASIQAAPAVSISFDLWMNNGAQDIFSIMSHSISPSFEKECFHLGLLKMDGSNGQNLAVTLKKNLDNHGVTNKVLAYVFDGGSNLAKCRDVLSSTVTCGELSVSFPYAGNCWAHILNTAISKTIGPSSNHDAGLVTFKFKDVKKKLQSCTTWTKKSGLGARAWEKACVTAGLAPKKLYTPVKTRFGSIVLMLERILEYREAVTICFGQASRVDLHVRNPSVTDWHVALRVFQCLKPIMDTYVLNQATESWLLSDTVSSCVTLTIELTKISRQALPTDGSVEVGTFNYELGVYLREAVTSSRDYITQHLRFLEAFDGSNAHYVIALLLDPRYTRLTVFVEYAGIDGSANIPHIKQTVREYLDVLIEWLQSIHNRTHGHDASQNRRNQEMEDAFGLFDVTSPEDANVESIVRNEFSLYQRECLNYARDTLVLKWIFCSVKTGFHT